MNPPAENSCASLAERVYPTPLAAAEAAMIRTRRKDAGLAAIAESDPRKVVRSSRGLAFSGGGIRSATFCLGVAQVLAQRRWLKGFDFLSTVSGGGYCGSFIGKLIQERKSPDTASEDIADSQSWPIRWLRENGYYLSPGGGADFWVIVSLLLRNWVAIHVVLATLLVLPFLFAAAARRALWHSPVWLSLEPYFVPGMKQDWFAFSPLALPLVLCFALGMLIPGVLFWVTQWHWLFPSVDDQERWQVRFTRWLAAGSKLCALLLLVAVMDTAAIWLHFAFLKSPTFTAGFAVIYGAAAIGFGWVQKFAGKLTALASKPGKSPRMFTIAKIAGLVWAALFWLLLAVAGQTATWWGQSWPVGCACPLLRLQPGWSTLFVIALALLALVIALARVYSFVNLSSLHQFYSARLGRAYLGASNPERKKRHLPVTEPHKSDDCPWRKYEPHVHGGPLHVVNTTLNETIGGTSQIEQIDRKGVNLALGPAGISASTTHHALWVKDAPDDGITDALSPIDGGPGSRHMFAIFPGKMEEIRVERLWLSDWVGISGAAFSTGMGAQTSVGLSLLLGFANVRLGYWWNTGITRSRDDVQRRNELGLAFAKLFPAPSSLLEEMLARFSGPLRPHWYLSDGGHFENTACYELLRRRVGFILCVDCGQDEQLAFEDVANLARKARIDFGAEVEFVTGKDEVDATLNLPQVPPEYRTMKHACIGLPKAFKSLASKSGEVVESSGDCHALLARVHYDLRAGEESTAANTGTVILFLKPSLSSDEPLDLRQYHFANADFPQQTTMDQFFDEAQWESYRRLGEHVASTVFPAAAAPAPR